MKNRSLPKIRTLGNPSLRTPSNSLIQSEFGTAELANDIHRLKSAMAEYGGIGIAGPQIGIQKRIIVIGVSPDNPRYSDGLSLPLVVLINPTWHPLNQHVEKAFEGCLSLPGLRGPVSRNTSILVEAYNFEGKPIRFQAEGAFARIVQHELDHLDGVLYVDRIAEEDLHRFGFEASLKEAGEDFSILGGVEPRWQEIHESSNSS